MRSGVRDAWARSETGGLAQVWVPSMGNVRGDSGEKLVAVASTKVRLHTIYRGILAPLCLLDQPGLLWLPSALHC